MYNHIEIVPCKALTEWYYWWLCLSSGLGVFSIGIFSVPWVTYICKKVPGLKLNRKKKQESNKEHSMIKKYRQKKEFLKSHIKAQWWCKHQAGLQFAVFLFSFILVF